MKKTIMTFVLFSLAAALQAAPGDPKPDWVDGSSVEYPREMYITGVGFADNRAAAEDKAIAQISRTLSTTVSVDSNVSESEKNQSGEKASFSQSISQSVRTTSQKALEGVEVVSNWQDETGKQFFALAVLDRAKAVSTIGNKIAELDGQIIEFKKLMDGAKEKMPRVKAAMKLLLLLKARSELNSELRVLDAEGKTVASAVNEAEVRPQASKALSELNIVVNLNGKGSEEIKTGVINGLTQFGLQAELDESGKSSGDINIDGKISSSPSPGSDDRWKWARTTVALSLKDGKSNKVFSRVDSSDRQASAEYEEAVRRTHIALGTKVALQLKEAITEYFENQ